ncbi:MAG TPA: BatA domain-containing protein [Planctomycetota bacterium]|nr:BatA domain-containing protein [Planctomycetota bacterium]
MINFLNIALVGGLIAVSAPIIIHLLHRSKVMPHDWGAMMFLEELIAERAKRIRMHELILLIVRALIVLCVALAMMQPVIKWASAGVRAPGVHTSAIIVLDDSYSMNAGRPRSAWLEAREQALRYVDTLQRGDDAAVLLTSQAGKGPPPAPLFDLERIKEIIRSAEPRYERTDMPAVIAAATEALEGRHNPHRELVIFSDMQAAGWEMQDGARWSFLSSAVKSSKLPANIVLASVAERRPVNAAITGLSASRAVVDCFSPVSFNITVANEGPEAMHGIAVTFAVDGAPKLTRTIDLPVEGREVLTFEHKFERPGSHYVSCKLRASADVLADDDELLHSVMVIDRLPVLIVDGDRRASVLSSESGFLKLALAPRDNEDPLWRTVIEPTVIDASELKYRELGKFKVIILANVAALPGTVVSELERFVIAGGGLFVSLGDRVQIDAYNRDLYRQGGGLLPVPLERIRGVKNDVVQTVAAGGEAKQEALHLGGIVSDVPALDLFRPEKGNDWSKALIRNYISVGTTGNKEDVRTLATLSTGAPVLIQKRLGEGKVLLFTTAVDNGWSDLPVHPFYVPLMQNLVLDLASAVIPPRNIQVGQVLSYVAAGDDARRGHQLAPPKGDLVTLKPQTQGALSIFSHEDTSRPGLYSIMPENAPPEQRTFYVIGPDRRESSLQRLKREDYAKLERDIGARHAPDWSTLASLIGLDAGGYDVSQYMLMLAVALCFLETYLTRRWA